MKTKGKKIFAMAMLIMFVITNMSVQPMSVQAAEKKATTIQLNATRKSMYVGQKITLKVKKVKPAKASKAVSWKSSNKKVATVNSKG